MIGLLLFLGIAVVYVGLGLLIERRNGLPSHDQPVTYPTAFFGGNWNGCDTGGGSGGFGGDCGGSFGGDCGGGFGGDCGGGF